MNAGDAIYLTSPNHGGGRRFRAMFCRDRKTDPPTVAIKLGDYGVEELIARPSEIELVSDVEARELEEKKKELQPVIDAWDSGLRTSKEIADNLLLAVPVVVGAIRACVNRGWITKEEPVEVKL